MDDRQFDPEAAGYAPHPTKNEIVLSELLDAKYDKLKYDPGMPDLPEEDPETNCAPFVGGDVFVSVRGNWLQATILKVKACAGMIYYYAQIRDTPQSRAMRVADTLNVCTADRIRLPHRDPSTQPAEPASAWEIFAPVAGAPSQLPTRAPTRQPGATVEINVPSSPRAILAYYKSLVTTMLNDHGDVERSESISSAGSISPRGSQH